MCGIRPILFVRLDNKRRITRPQMCWGSFLRCRNGAKWAPSTQVCELRSSVSTMAAQVLSRRCDRRKSRSIIPLSYKVTAASYIALSDFFYLPSTKVAQNTRNDHLLAFSVENCFGDNSANYSFPLYAQSCHPCDRYFWVKALVRGRAEKALQNIRLRMDRYSENILLRESLFSFLFTEKVYHAFLGDATFRWHSVIISTS